ncbi:MAG: hypothetical protein M3Q46_11180 [Verrucomicrobiota bacterium]|nr:hypothetical protein [Verrucomicrobiota bacterium]
MPTYRIPTGELLRKLRPAIYRQIVDLLAEPREHVSYREIARVCKVGGGTVKAIEQAEAEDIAATRAKLLRTVTRVVERAWSTVEDKLETANLAQATICAGIATEKMLLLSGQATQNVQLDIKATDIYSKMNELTAEIVGAVRALPAAEPKLLPIEAEVVSVLPAA